MRHHLSEDGVASKYAVLRGTFSCLEGRSWQSEPRHSGSCYCLSWPPANRRPPWSRRLPRWQATGTANLHEPHQGASNPGHREGTCPGSPAQYGWHFVLGPDTDFVTITATFQDAGQVSSSGPFNQPTSMHAYLYTSGPDTLLNATAQVNGPSTRFVLSTCARGHRQRPRLRPLRRKVAGRPLRRTVAGRPLTVDGGGRPRRRTVADDHDGGRWRDDH